MVEALQSCVSAPALAVVYGLSFQPCDVMKLLEYQPKLTSLPQEDHMYRDRPTPS